jgi:hypothetical protein
MNYQTIQGLPGAYLQALKKRIFQSLKRTGGCLEWQGALSDNGYGRISVLGTAQRVHRVAYELFNGPIPEGMFVCHKCDNPPCCEPGHLFLGTPKQNTADMHNKGRQAPWQYNTDVAGEKNPRAKLTAVDVLQIRRRYTNSSVTLKQLAEEYGVHFDTISKAVNGVTWSHLKSQSL